MVSPAKPIGLLLTNIGSPDAPTRNALRRYLKEFLWDPRIIEVPRVWWWIILNGIILKLRPQKSAQLYKKIWNVGGSPLLVTCERIRQKLADALQQQYSQRFIVSIGMRYGIPAIAETLRKLKAEGCRDIFVLPLFPQYSGTTTGSTFDAVTTEIRKWRDVPALHFSRDYHDFHLYIQALTNSINDFWKIHGKPEQFLISYNGIPFRYVRAGDPYRQECEATTALLISKLGLPKNSWKMGFQSRFGREPWLEPYTQNILKEWGEQGVRSVHVICPGFSCDCLETLSEIAMEYRDVFGKAGGQSFHYIPALNEQDDHIQCLLSIIEHHLSGLIQSDEV